jgi:hypothetical protein
VQEARELRLIATRYCPEYRTEAKLFVHHMPRSRLRRLVVHYAKGGLEGRPEFTATVPANWSDQDILDLLERPMPPRGKYPAWEIPARLFFSPRLFKWWAGQRPGTPLQ